jgi:chromosome segregation ATPase
MVGLWQIFTASAVLLSSCLSSLALPINTQREPVDPLTLIATGLLNQEKRLQAVEQKLLGVSSAPSTYDWGTAQTTDLGRTEGGRMQQQQVLNREELDMETRVTYLEEDVADHRHSTDHKLQVVYDQAKELQRKESEDIRELHGELAGDVDILEKEINSSFQETEKDINAVDKHVDSVDKKVNYNTKSYNFLHGGFYEIIEYIREVQHELKNSIHDLDTELQEVKKQVSDLQENKEPSVGPVGNTGGIQSSHTGTVSSAEKALREWMKQDPANRDDSSIAARVESAETKLTQTSLEELMHELNKYNM